RVEYMHAVEFREQFLALPRVRRGDLLRAVVAGDLLQAPAYLVDGRLPAAHRRGQLAQRSVAQPDLARRVRLLGPGVPGHRLFGLPRGIGRRVESLAQFPDLEPGLTRGLQPCLGLTRPLGDRVPYAIAKFLFLLGQPRKLTAFGADVRLARRPVVGEVR